MKLSSTSLTAITEKPSIIEHIDFLCSTDSNSYALADKLRNINIWYGKVIAKILASAHGWKWDDTNYSDAPRGTQTLSDGTSSYTLPVAVVGNDASTFLTFEKASVLDSAGKESPLEPAPDDEATMNNIYSTSGLPQYYKLVGKKIYLWPAPATAQVTLTNGLIIYYTRTPDLFTNSDTTQEPGFPAIFHEILAIGPAYEFAAARGKENATTLFQRAQLILKDIEDFYSSRNEDITPGVRTKHTAFN